MFDCSCKQPLEMHDYHCIYLIKCHTFDIVATPYLVLMYSGVVLLWCFIFVCPDPLPCRVLSLAVQVPDILQAIIPSVEEGLATHCLMK